MAVNSYQKSGKQDFFKLLGSQTSNSNIKMYVFTNENPHKDFVCNEKQDKYTSPYFNEKKSKVFSRNIKASQNITKTADLVSPLTMNINRTNSDDFKNIKHNMSRKTKKSVLTLPNNPVPSPQMCTVSDMNESEYFQEPKCEQETKTLRKKQSKNKRKFRCMRNNLENCEVPNPCLDYSSSSSIKHFAGDGIRKIKSKNIGKNKPVNPSVKDVWTIIKKVNKFQFISSPTMSENSISSKVLKMKYSMFNSLRAEESGNSYYDNDNSYSQSTFDRVTVIDKQKALGLQNKDEKKIVVKTNNVTKKIDNNVKKIETSLDTVGDDKIKQYLKQNVKLNRNNFDETKKYSDIKLWLENMNPLNTGRLSLHYKKNIRDSGNKQNLDVPSLKDNDCVTSTHINKVNSYFKAGSKSQLMKVNNYEQKNGSIRLKQSENLSPANHSNQSNEALNAITKVVLNKPKNIVIQGVRSPLSGKIINHPKLTQGEIKRRLAKMKFPIVILEKDQLCSVAVENYEAIQFSGLDEHIWPFMVDWLNPMPAKKNNLQENYVNNLFKRNNNNYCDKRISIYRDNTIIDRRTETKSPELQKRNQILTVKQTNVNLPKKNINTAPKVWESNRKEGTEDLLMITMKSKNKTAVTNTISRQTPIKNSWGSAKQASEFIENVIKKIRNGVYFNHEWEMLKKTDINFSTKSTQTVILLPDNDSVPQLSIELRREYLDAIPGFDKCLTDLKIETFNSNQVVIKHCKTNVIFKFDIISTQVSQYNIRSRKNISFKPLLVENKAKVFKCERRIISTELPSALCSILPKTINRIFDFNRSLKNKNRTKALIADNNPNLSEAVNKYDSLVPNIRDILNKFDGQFLEKMIYKPTNHKTHSVLKAEIKSHKNELLDVCSNLALDIIINPELLIFDVKKYVSCTEVEESVVLENQEPVCMSIQLYSIKNKQIVPAYKRFNILDMLEVLRYINNFILARHTPTMLELKMIGVNDFLMAVEDNDNPICEIKFKSPIQEHENTELITVMIASINHSNYIECNNSYCDLSQVEYEDNSLVVHNKTNILNRNFLENFVYKSTNYLKPVTKIRKQNSLFDIKANNKIASRIERRQFSFSFRRRNVLKKDKCCKSMSNISDCSSNTWLSNITCIQDFYKILGPTKALCSALDKDMERIIISSIAAMKNWITHITPTQAFLVLLLATRKESPNLVRYRLIILQGIAVNRITRVSELNMEIDVMENENFNKLPQFSGMNCIPESLENQNALLEELIWIAKTTASDYQKTFDECSERHIRSLLEKRKKLNPSYLRVMARYVGLGLLKKPK